MHARPIHGYDPVVSSRAASYYRARYYDPAAGRFLGEDPEAFLAGTNFYSYVGNDPIEWTDPSGLEKCKKKCGIKKPPKYDEQGTIHGPVELLIHAEFLNDAEHSPACCEVRVQISWTQASPPTKYFQGDSPNNWYYDAGPPQNGSSGPCMLGVRSGPNSCLGPGNSYAGNSFNGSDLVSLHHPETLAFRLLVLDICDGGKAIYTSRTPLYVKFP